MRRISTVDVKPEMLQHLPSLGGETDIFRALQLLPGIKASSEISSAQPGSALIRFDILCFSKHVLAAVQAGKENWLENTPRSLSAVGSS